METEDLGKKEKKKLAEANLKKYFFEKAENECKFHMNEKVSAVERFNMRWLVSGQSNETAQDTKQLSPADLWE